HRGRSGARDSEIGRGPRGQRRIARRGRPGPVSRPGEVAVRSDRPIKQCLAVALLAQAALPACAPSVEQVVFTEPASARRYSVFTRRFHDGRRPSPVLLVLHAYATDPTVLGRAYALERRAAAGRDWILVVPEGTRDADGQLFWNAAAACCGNSRDRPDDLAYLHRVLEDL